MDSFLVNTLNAASYAFLLFLIASGLSLIFGVMGVLNLSHGALYMLGAYIGLTMVGYWHNFWLALVLAAVGVGIVGLVMERVFLSRLYKQLNEQVLLTLGLVYIFANAVLWIWGAYAKMGGRPALLANPIDIGVYHFPSYRLGLIIIGLAVFLVLWWLHDKTRIGAMIRAGMDDKQMTIGLGINYGLISTFTFIIGAVMGGFAGFLGTPIIGAEPEMSMPILLMAMIVVVVGGLGNIKGALLGSLIIGFIDTFGKVYFADFAMFTVYLIFIIMLLVRPTGLLGRKTEYASSQAYPSLRQKEGLKIKTMTDATQMKHWWQRHLGTNIIPYAICFAILIILPPFVSGYIQSMLAKILIFGLFAISLNLFWGYTGMFSLGHAAYFGVGGYAAGILSVHYGVESFWIIAAVGILMAVVFAAILGIPALRMSGAYFLLVTLAFGELLFNIAVKWRSMTGSVDGLVGIPYPNLGIPGLNMNNTYFYYLVFIAFIICLFLMYRLVKSPFGSALKGIRENEPRMKALGYNTWLYKYLTFIIGGLFAGVAGVLFVHFGGIMAPTQLGIMTSTLVMLMVILGGDNTFFGPAIGAVIVVVLEHVASLYAPERWPMILGGVFVLAVMFLRGGVSIYLVRLWKKVPYRSVSS